MNGPKKQKSKSRSRKVSVKGTTEAGSTIPHAPIGRRSATAADKELNKWRAIMDEEFPLMTPEQISRSEQPYHLLLLHDMMSNGDTIAAQEISSIFKKEERERKGGRYRHLMSPIHLKDQLEKLEKIAETLRVCHFYYSQGHLEAAINLRKQLAEKFMHEGDIWLAKHFFLSTLQACKKIGQESSQIDKIQAEVHCLLAFLARENNETLESALAIAIDHLAYCRQLSQDQPWQFKPHVMTIKLKKPIAIHGLRFEEGEIFEIVDGCSMTVYMIASLLEHEMLISLANQIMHTHKAPTDDDVKVAHEFADHALKLALEVRQPTAMSSALVRFGLVLRHSGAYEDALNYFEQLKQHCILTGDYTSEAIAYHNIGICLIGCHNSKEALECFAKQMDIATDFKMKDLEADAMHEVGHLLLQEGHLWEAEECYAVAHDDFKAMRHTGSHEAAAWAMLGVSAGHKLWGRFANLSRSNMRKDIYSLLDWKCSRRQLNSINRPNYKPEHIFRAFEPYISKMQPQPLDDGSDKTDYELLADSQELSSDSQKEVKPEKPTVAFADLPLATNEGEIEEETLEQDLDATELDVSQFESEYQPPAVIDGAETEMESEIHPTNSTKSIKKSVSMNLHAKQMTNSKTSRTSLEPIKESKNE